MKNIFIRITKSAGTLLNNIYKKDNNYIILTPTITNLKKFINIKNYNKIITNIREPFNKIYSSYNFLVNNYESNLRCKNIIPFKNLSFKKYLYLIKNLKNNLNKYNLSIKNKIVISNNELNKDSISYQIYWILQHNELIFNSIYFFIQKEDLENYIKCIFIEDLKNLPKINSNKYKKKKITDFDKETQLLFNNLFSKDIEFYKKLIKNKNKLQITFNT